MGSLLLLGAGGKIGGAVPLGITSANTVSNAENTTLAHALTATESATWSIIGGADQTKFEISGSTLRWLGNVTRNFEIPVDSNLDNAYVVQVRATNLGALTADQTITVTVTDVASEIIPWVLAGSWTFSSNVAQVDFTGLAGYTEILSLIHI